jgi:hypothetical protein
MAATPDMEGYPPSGDAGFSTLFSPLPSERQELPPNFVEKTLRKASVMLIGVAPKVGKIFLTAQMEVAFAMGTAVLGFSFTWCERILVVNTEMGAAEHDTASSTTRSRPRSPARSPGACSSHTPTTTPNSRSRR